MKKFISEFKDFINRGNVLDMAIGVIIATAFGKITTSIVNDILMPAIGLLFGGTDFTQCLNLIIREPVLNEAGEVVTAGVVIGFGTLLSVIINFIIIALFCFIIVKAFNKAKTRAEKKKKDEEAAAAAKKAAEEMNKPVPPTDNELLIEIRDLLKNIK